MISSQIIELASKEPIVLLIFIQVLQCILFLRFQQQYKQVEFLQQRRTKSPARSAPLKKKPTRKQRKQRNGRSKRARLASVVDHRGQHSVSAAANAQRHFVRASRPARSIPSVRRQRDFHPNYEPDSVRPRSQRSHRSARCQFQRHY